jgi:hypothetical protein
MRHIAIREFATYPMKPDGSVYNMGHVVLRSCNMTYVALALDEFAT